MNFCGNLRFRRVDASRTKLTILLRGYTSSPFQVWRVACGKIARWATAAKCADLSAGWSSIMSGNMSGSAYSQKIDQEHFAEAPNMVLDSSNIVGHSKKKPHTAITRHRDFSQSPCRHVQANQLKERICRRKARIHRSGARGWGVVQKTA